MRAGVIVKLIPKIGLLAAVIGTTLATSAYADTLAYNTSLADGVYFGSGNPNSNFTTLTTDQFELGLGTNLRFVGPVVPSPLNSAIYNVPTGILGSGSKWDFIFSVDWQSGFDLGADHWWLSVLNTANGQTLGFNPSSIGDNATNGHGFQNAESLGFAFISTFFPNFGYDPNQNDTFIVTLSLQNSSNADISSVSETINQTPLPAALPLFAGGLGVMSLLGWRRKRKVALAAAVSEAAL